MWSLVVVCVLAAASGFYMMPAERAHVTARNHEAREQAVAMAVYRAAVVAYFSANDLKNTSVTLATLTSTGALPDWSPLRNAGASLIWRNYRDGAGVIYIYPATLPAANIVSEVLALSQNALTVGIYRAADRSLYSPADGKRVVLATLGAVSIPDTALVWLAARQ